MNHAALNALVAEQVMGWPVIDEDTPFRTVREYGGFICNGVPEMFGPIGIIPVDHFDPSRNIAHAMEVLEEVVGTAYYQLDNGWHDDGKGGRTGGHTCTITLGTGTYKGTAADPAKAISLACVRARGVSEERIKEALDGKA